MPDNAYNSAYTGTQIDSAVAKVLNGLVINSSTEGSSKQFKLLVDDAGRLVVEEIA